MKVLYGALVVSVAAIVVAVGAMWLRLRWHLRRPGQTQQHTLSEMHPEHEPADKM